MEDAKVERAAFQESVTIQSATCSYEKVVIIGVLGRAVIYRFIYFLKITGKKNWTQHGGKRKRKPKQNLLLCSQETDRCLSTSSLRRVSKITNKKEKSMGLPRGECLECVKGGFQKRAHWVFLHLESEKYNTSHK